jgi:hypothetical protein
MVDGTRRPVENRRMTNMMMICRASEVAAVNAAVSQHMDGPNNLSVPLAENDEAGAAAGTATPTHYMGNLQEALPEMIAAMAPIFASPAAESAGRRMLVTATPDHARHLLGLMRLYPIVGAKTL